MHPAAPARSQHAEPPDRWIRAKAEFERFVSAARGHSPNALAIVLGLYGLRVSEVCDLQIEQLDWNHGQPVLRVAGKSRTANETSTFPVPRDVRQALLHAGGRRESGCR